MEFRSEIITNGQLNLDDIIFDDILLLNFVEYLGNKPEAILFTFLLAVSAYKKEFSELTSVSDASHDPSKEHYKQLLEDATTICAKFLSPASDDFMNLSLEEYRSALDQACSEEEPRLDCFDSLYEVIHRKVEKRILPGFFTSSPFLRYRAQFISTLDSWSRESNQVNGKPSTAQLDVIALTDVSLSTRLPDVSVSKRTRKFADTLEHIGRWGGLKVVLSKESKKSPEPRAP
ncbi:hypothetical protein SprV_0200913000 [Sparganum proliferum]